MRHVTVNHIPLSTKARAWFREQGRKGGKARCKRVLPSEEARRIARYRVHSPYCDGCKHVSVSGTCNRRDWSYSMIRPDWCIEQGGKERV